MTVRICGCVHTPWLHVKRNDGFRRRLRLARLLLPVLLQALGLHTLGLCVLLLVLAAEEVDVVIVTALSLLLAVRCLGRGRVGCELRGLWAVGGVLLAWVARQAGEL